MRHELSIPKDALVIGRHGGFETFDLKFVHRAVIDALELRKDMFFIFVNTRRFCEHERAIFLPPILDNLEKANFINTCDFMLHAKARGESFGLAVAEFMSFDKPVICWAGGTDRNHLHMIPNRSFVYKSYHDLVRLLAQLERRTSDGSWRNRVAEFAPAPVMEKFKREFIETERQNQTLRPSMSFIIKRNTAQRIFKARYDMWREGIRI